MKFSLVIDPTREEEVVMTVHRPTPLAEQIQALILQEPGPDRIAGYTEEGIEMLSISAIECITVEGGKTYAIDSQNRRFRLKQRLYELEQWLPPTFIRINKSALANERSIRRFAVTFSGAVDAVFKCGYKEYVSRRCFAEIKRRFE